MDRFIVRASLKEKVPVSLLVRRSVGPSVCWSVGPSVHNPFFKCSKMLDFDRIGKVVQNEWVVKVVYMSDD